MLLAAARMHWNALPDAIVTYNDTMAIGILRYLREHGVTVPDDLSVTGFDDIEIAGYLYPPLTTWRQPRYAMGATAMRMMLGLIEGSWPAAEKHLVIRGELVSRGSTHLRP
jgi:DNA-binding LacI/PurR family transcriptional regulator